MRIKANSLEEMKQTFAGADGFGGPSPEDTPIISIGSPGTFDYEWFKEGLDHHIRLEFDDVWKVGDREWGWSESDYKPVDQKIERAVELFPEMLEIAQHRSTDVITHCYAGVSRSTAMAMLFVWWHHLMHRPESAPSHAAREAYGHVWSNRRHSEKDMYPNPTVLRIGESLIKELYNVNASESEYLLREVGRWQPGRIYGGPFDIKY